MFCDRDRHQIYMVGDSSLREAKKLYSPVLGDGGGGGKMKKDGEEERRRREKC